MSIRAAAVHDLPRIKQIAAAAQMFTAEEVSSSTRCLLGPWTEVWKIISGLS